MTHEKMRELKTSLWKETEQVFELCFFIMENSQSAPLLTTTLSTLLRWLSWVPINYIMDTTLIENLVLKVCFTRFFRCSLSLFLSGLCVHPRLIFYYL
jgi:exportin-1